MANPFDEDVRAIASESPTNELEGDVQINQAAINSAVDNASKASSFDSFKNQAFTERKPPMEGIDSDKWAQTNQVDPSRAKDLLTTHSPEDAKLLGNAEALAQEKPGLIEWAGKKPENYKYLRDHFPELMEVTKPENTWKAPYYLRDMSKALKRNMPMLENMVAVGRYSVGEMSKEEFAEKLENIRQRRDNQTPYATDVAGFEQAMKEFNRSWKEGDSFADMSKMPVEDMDDFIKVFVRAAEISGASYEDIMNLTVAMAINGDATFLKSIESLGSMVGPTVGAVAGGWAGRWGGPKTALVGGLAGGTVGSGLVRYAQEVEEQLNNYVDANPGATYLQALENPEVMANVKKVATAYGLVGGLLDTTLTRLGGNIASKGVKGYALSLGVDAVGEGVAEAGATTAKGVAEGKPVLKAASEGVREGVIESLLVTPTSATMSFIPGVSSAMANKAIDLKRKTNAKAAASEVKGQMDKVRDAAKEVVNSPEDAAKLRDALDTLTQREEVAEAREAESTEVDMPETPVTDAVEETDTAIPEETAPRPRSARKRSALGEEAALENVPEIQPEGVAINPGLLYQKFHSIPEDQRKMSWDEYLRYFPDYIQEQLKDASDDTLIVYIKPQHWAIAQSQGLTEDLDEVVMVNTPWGMEPAVPQDEEVAPKKKEESTLPKEQQKPLTSEEQDHYAWLTELYDEDRTPEQQKELDTFKQRIKEFGEEGYLNWWERPTVLSEEEAQQEKQQTERRKELEEKKKNKTITKDEEKQLTVLQEQFDINRGKVFEGSKDVPKSPKGLSYPEFVEVYTVLAPKAKDGTITPEEAKKLEGYRQKVIDAHELKGLKDPGDTLQIERQPVVEVKPPTKGVKTAITKQFGRFKSLAEENLYNDLKKRIIKALGGVYKQDILEEDRSVPSEVVQLYTDMFFNMAKERARILGKPLASIMSQYEFADAGVKGFAGFISTLLPGHKRTIIGYNKKMMAKGGSVSTIVHEFGHILLNNMITDWDAIHRIDEDKLTPEQRHYRSMMQLTARVLNIPNLKGAFDRVKKGGKTHNPIQEKFATSIELFFKRGEFKDTDTGKLMLRFQQLMQKFMTKEQLNYVGQGYVKQGTTPIRPETDRGQELSMVFNSLIDANEKLVQEAYALVPPPEFDRKDMGEEYEKWMDKYRDAVETALLKVYKEIYNDNIDFYRTHYNEVYSQEYEKLLKSRLGSLHNLIKDGYIVLAKRDIKQHFNYKDADIKVLQDKYGLSVVNKKADASTSIGALVDQGVLDIETLQSDFESALRLEETAVANTIQALEAQNEVIPRQELKDLSNIILTDENIRRVREEAGQIVKRKLLKELGKNKDIAEALKKDIRKGLTEAVLTRRAKTRFVSTGHKFFSMASDLVKAEREIEKKRPGVSFNIFANTNDIGLFTSNSLAYRTMEKYIKSSKNIIKASAKKNKEFRVKTAIDTGEVPEIFDSIEQQLISEKKESIIKKVNQHLDRLQEVWDRETGYTQIRVTKEGQPDIYIIQGMVSTEKDMGPRSLETVVMEDDGVHDLAKELMQKQKLVGVWNRLKYGHLLMEADLKARVLAKLQAIPTKKTGVDISREDISKLTELSVEAMPITDPSPNITASVLKKISTAVDILMDEDVQEYISNMDDEYTRDKLTNDVFYMPDVFSRAGIQQYHEAGYNYEAVFARVRAMEEAFKEKDYETIAKEGIDLYEIGIELTPDQGVEAMPLPPVPKTAITVGEKKSMSISDAHTAVANKILSEVKTLKKAREMPSNMFTQYMYMDSISMTNFIASMMDEKDLPSSILYEIFRNVSTAESKKNTVQIEMHRKLKKAVDKYSKTQKGGKSGIFKFLSQATTKNDKIIKAPEIGEGVTFSNLGQVITALLYMGSESGRAKLMLGGFLNSEGIDTGPLGLDNGSEIDTSGWDAFIQRLINEGTLNEQAFDFVQEVHDIFTEIYPLVKQSFIDVEGQTINFVEGRAYTVKFADGTTKKYKGGYYPLLPDRTLVPVEGTTPGLSQDAHSIVYDVLDYSMSKQRGGQIYPLQLGLGNLMGLLNRHLTHAYIKKPMMVVENLKKNRKIMQLFENRQRGFVEKVLNPWIERTTRQRYTVPGSSPFQNSMGLFFRRSAYIYLFLAKLGPIGKQFLGIIQAMPTTGQYVGSARMLKHFIKVAAGYTTFQYPGLKKEIAEKSVFMKDRLDNNERHLVRGWDQMELAESTYGNIVSKGESWAFLGMQVAQNIVDMGIWLAAVEKVKADGKSDKEAFAYADGLVERTQASSNISAKPRALHGTNWERLGMMITMVSHGIRGRIYENAVRADDKGNSKFLARLNAITMMVIIPGVIEHAVSQALEQLGGDEEDKKDPEIPELFARLLGDTAQAYSPMIAQMILPLIGGGVDIAVGAKGRGRGGEFFGLGPVANPLRKGSRGITAAFESMKYGVPMSNKDIENLIAAVALLTSLPIAPATYITKIIEMQKTDAQKRREARKRRKKLDRAKKRR